MTADVAPPAAGSARLHLFTGPYVTLGGQRVELPAGSQRLLVYVVLAGVRVDRRSVAGLLWPIGNDVRAAGNLRSALWRLRAIGIDLVEGDKGALWLRPGTAVDLREVSDWATRLIDGRAEPADLTRPAWSAHAQDLLPGWYDDWVVFERERLRQRLLHALEALSRRLAWDGRHAEAVDVALSAVAADPLRESAQRALVEAHLAEGNVVEARRAYETFRDALRGQLGVCPGPALASLVGARPAVVRPLGAVPAPSGRVASAARDRGATMAR